MKNLQSISLRAEPHTSFDWNMLENLLLPLPSLYEIRLPEKSVERISTALDAHLQRNRKHFGSLLIAQNLVSFPIRLTVFYFQRNLSSL